MSKDEREDLRTLGEVRVKVVDLKKHVEANRKTHRKAYEEAKKDWEEAVVDWFKEQGEKAAEGKKFITAFGLARPEEHTQEYDSVLKMLELTLDEELILEAREFDQYVMDQWGWMKAVTASYMSTKETKADLAEKRRRSR